MKLNERKRATVLAALRQRQQCLSEDADDRNSQFDQDACGNGRFDALSIDEIDELCEEFNTNSAVEIQSADSSGFHGDLAQQGRSYVDASSEAALFEQHWEKLTLGEKCFSAADRALAVLFYVKGKGDGAHETVTGQRPGTSTLVHTGSPL